MSERLILGLAGAFGTGKSTLANYLEVEHGFKVVESSAVIRQTAAKLGLELNTRDEYAALYREQQDRLGPGWISDIVLNSESERVLQSGLRNRVDSEKLKDAGGEVIGLICPPEVCIARIDTDTPKNPSTKEDYIDQLKSEESPDNYGLHTLFVVSHANHKIDTSSPLEFSQELLDRIVRNMLRRTA